MFWIVENYAKEASYAELIEAIKASGDGLLELTGDFKRSHLDDFRQNPQCVLFCGSINMTHMILSDLNMCAPVAFNTPQNFLCTKYYSHFGKFLFNDKYSFVSLAELQRQKFYFYGAYGKESLIFIRPDSGQKTFQAQLLDLIDLDRFCTMNKDVAHELVLVSTPKTIQWEGRFIVSHHEEIIAYSTYQFQGQRTLIPSVPEKALKKCKEILKVGYFPNPVFVIDLCQDSDGDFWLLELNSFSSAGLYASDKKAIVTRVSQIAEAEWKKYSNNQ